MEFSTEEPGPRSVRATDKVYYWVSGHRIHATQGGAAGDLLHGPYRAFDADGRLRELGDHFHGLRHGEWRSWDEQGNLVLAMHWRHGVCRDTVFPVNAHSRPQRFDRHIKPHDAVPSGKEQNVKWYWPFRRQEADSARTPRAAVHGKTPEKATPAKKRGSRDRKPSDP